MGPMGGREPAVLSGLDTWPFHYAHFKQLHQLLLDSILNPEDTRAFYALSNAMYSPAPLSLLRNGESRSIFQVSIVLAPGSIDPPLLAATIALEVLLSPSLA